jgi:uncharacterized protein (DUF885 family)
LKRINNEDGWTRAQAVKYMQDNPALADQNIATEADHYIGRVRRGEATH